MERIQDLYGSFGPEVVRQVRLQLIREGDLTPLLRRLGISSAPGSRHQHQALREFIYRYGMCLFLDAVRGDLQPEEIERRKIERLVQISRTHIAGKQPEQPSSESDAADEPPAGPILERGADFAVKADDQDLLLRRSLLGESRAPAESVAMISTPDYSGPDRRVTDRRQRKFGRRMSIRQTTPERRRAGRDRRQMLRREHDRR